MRCGENLETTQVSEFQVSSFKDSAFQGLLLIGPSPTYFGTSSARPAPRREARAGPFPASLIVKDQKGLRAEGTSVPHDARPKQSPHRPKVHGGQPPVVASLGS